MGGSKRRIKEILLASGLYEPMRRLNFTRGERNPARGRQKMRELFVTLLPSGSLVFDSTDVVEPVSRSTCGRTHSKRHWSTAAARVGRINTRLDSLSRLLWRVVENKQNWVIARADCRRGIWRQCSSAPDREERDVTRASVVDGH